MNRLSFFLFLFLTGCHNDNPAASEQTPEPQLPDLPRVAVTQTDYAAGILQMRVPDTSLKNKCCSQYMNGLTDSMRRSVAAVLLQKALRLGQDTSVVSSCLKATGQMKEGLISVLYLAEKAQYLSKECWIFEFTWGMNAADLGHHRCFVMNAATQDTLLFITCM
jgi:hypothetical protein